MAEMEPLFSAVYHGCQAKREQEIFDGLYYERVLRRERSFLNDALGGNEEDVALLANFFDRPWNQPSENLNKTGKAEVLNFAGYALRAIGRFDEAESAMKAGIPIREGIPDYAEASNDNRNLSELLIFRGQILDAIPYASRAVELAKLASGLHPSIVAFRTCSLGNALFLSGKTDEAEVQFLEAEEIIAKEREWAPFLGGISAFCRLRMHAHLDEQEKAIQLVEKIPQGNWKPHEVSELTKGLEVLGEGIVLTLEHIARPGDPTSAHSTLMKAVSQLRRAGVEYYICLGLAYLSLLTKSCAHDKLYEASLSEAQKIAERIGARGLTLDLDAIALQDGKNGSDIRQLFDRAEALGYGAFEYVFFPWFR